MRMRNNDNCPADGHGNLLSSLWGTLRCVGMHFKTTKDLELLVMASFLRRFWASGQEFMTLITFSAATLS
jgi:hypothetical protein